MPGTRSADPPQPAPEPLGLTVHALPDPLAQRRGGHWRMLLVLLICAAPVVASYLTFYVIRPDGATAAYGQLIEPPRDMPALPAADPQGRALPLETLKGQWLLVMVDDARCAESCEKRLYAQRQLREMLGRERERLDKVWIATGDAAVAAPLLRALADTPAMHVLRLPESAVAGWLQPAPGQRVAEHFYLIDPSGRWMMRFPPDAQPAKVKRDLDRLLRAAASWDKAGR